LKRLIFSKRNFKGFLVDILIPALLVIAGFGLSTINFFVDSDQRTLEANLFPLKQRVLYNNNEAAASAAASTLISKLTPSSDFETTLVTVSGASNTAKLQNFDDQCYTASKNDPIEPYRYANYYFETINQGTQTYHVVSFANITSQEATVAVPHFIYQAILKYATNNDGFIYEMINDPMPVTQKFKDREQAGNGIFMGFVMSIAFALIPTSIISFIVHERENSLVHQQIISGMSKLSYWSANYSFDLIKAYFPTLVAIAFLYIYSLELDYAWLLIFLFPLAIVPYTYVTSFLFSDEVSAQNFTLMHTFLIGGMAPIGVFVLRIIEDTSDIGDALAWLPRIIPAYCTCGGIVTISVKDSIANSRKESVPDALDWEVSFYP
jgi:ATP-binding cassette subfamily A (ABC1) protein 3